MTSTTTTTSTSSSTTEFEIVQEFGQPYHDAVIKFKSIWPNCRKVTRELAEPVNRMVDIIFEIHPDWSVRKALSQIASDLGDLKGFSVRQLYRFLDHVFDLERLKKVSSRQRIVVNEKGEEGEGIREARFEDSSLFYNNTKNQVPTVEPSPPSPNLEHVIAELEERLKRKRQASPSGLAGAVK